MADFLNINGYFSKVWPSGDGLSYHAYFVANGQSYYVFGKLASQAEMPHEYRKANLHIKTARDTNNQQIVNRSGKQKYWVEQLNPDLSAIPGLRKYLTSKVFDGIGVKTVDKLLDLYGKDVLKVIRNETARLKNDGFTKRQIETLQLGLDDPDIGNMLMQLMPDMPQQCAETLGDYYSACGYDTDKVRRIIKKDPYRLFRDLSENNSNSRINKKQAFIAIDQLAMTKYNFSSYHNYRIDTAIDIVADSISDAQKSTYADLTGDQAMSGFIHRCMEYLWAGDIAKSQDAVEKRLAVRCSFTGNKRMLYTRRMLTAEIKSVNTIKQLLTMPPVWPSDEDSLNSLINSYRTEEGYELDDVQKLAVKTAVSKRLSVITGGPGTGKTTILNAIVWLWRKIMPVFDKNNMPRDLDFSRYDRTTQKKVYLPLELNEKFLMAPTGKAAQRMNEKITARENGDDATTVAFRLMLARRNADPASCDNPTYYGQKLVIIDESSMLSMEDAADILELMKKCQLVFVGDPDQLLPVGKGQFLNELVSYLTFMGRDNLVTLNTQHRSSGDGAIIYNAGIIKNGGYYDDKNQLIPAMPANCPGQYETIESDASGLPLKDDAVAKIAVEEYIRHYQTDPDSVCLITPMHPSSSPLCNDRGINIDIQNRVNPGRDLNPKNCRKWFFSHLGKSLAVDLYGIHTNETYDPMDANFKAHRGGKIYEAPYPEYKTAKTTRATTLRIGDRVTLTRNNYTAEMFNGDTGIIVGYMIADTGNDNFIIIRPDTPRTSGRQYCVIPTSRFGEIDLAYCLTVHKTQGSEYRNVIIALPQKVAENPLGDKSLIYTAETRAKSCVEIIGQRNIVWACIQKKPDVRKTNLLNRLVGPDYRITDPSLDIFD